MHALPSLSLRTVLTGGIGIEITCTRDTRHAHTHHHDTTGPEGGDCMLAGGCCERDPHGTQPAYTRQPHLERGTTRCRRGAKRDAVEIGALTVERIVSGKYEWRDAEYAPVKGPRKRLWDTWHA